jgi:hypothetical protein
MPIRELKSPIREFMRRIREFLRRTFLPLPSSGLPEMRVRQPSHALVPLISDDEKG